MGPEPQVSRYIFVELLEAVGDPSGVQRSYPWEFGNPYLGTHVFQEQLKWPREKRGSPINYSSVEEYRELQKFGVAVAESSTPSLQACRGRAWLFWVSD